MLRVTRSVATAIAAFAALTLASVGPGPSTQAASSGKPSPTVQQQLEARRAQLMTQLNALTAQQGGASQALASAEAAYQQAQSQLLAAQNQLAADNQKLNTLSQQITDDQKQDTVDQQQLALLTRTTYEAGGETNGLVTLLTSNSLSNAVSNLASSQSVSNQLQSLEQHLTTNEQTLTKDRAEVKTQFAQASSLEKQLAALSNQFMVAVAQRDQALNSVSPDVASLEGQIATIDNQLAGATSTSTPIGGSALPTQHVNGGAPCGDRFAFGQCTYYVATRRCIPWLGNADQWYYAAAAMGYAEGHSPEPGAVTVFWPGGDGASSVGHVAYVEAVGPGPGVGSYRYVPAGYFEISEMNFVGWDRVSYRLIPDGSGGVQGFIYGHR